MQSSASFAYLYPWGGATPLNECPYTNYTNKVLGVAGPKAGKVPV